MIHSPASIAAFENVLTKLIIRQKLFIYQIARLEYRIMRKLESLALVNTLIKDEEDNIKSLDAAIKAAGQGKVAQKLSVWKVKAVHKLFKLHLRKSKIDVAKLIFNQSKLEQLKQALASLEKDIASLKAQKPAFAPVAILEKKETETNKEGMLTFWLRSQQLMAQDPVNKSVREFLENTFRKAS